jgi:hypothetical protein
LGDVATELFVFHLHELAGEVGGDRGGGRDCSAHPTLGRSKRRLDRSDAETELLDGDLALVEPCDERCREHR